MRSEKYEYNPQTLQFEKVKITKKSVLLRVFTFLSSVIVTTLLFYFMTSEYFPSPREKALKKEITQMDYQFLLMKDQLERANKVLTNLQNRDAKVHRVLFGMDPIDPSVWNGGVGGHDPYAWTSQLRNSSGTVKDAKQYLDKLERQIYLQSKSLDTIEKLTRTREDMIASIPSIKPVRLDHLSRGVQQLSGFGIRLHPVHKVNKMHAGIDFTAPEGTSIQSTGDGKVIRIENKPSGYGKSVLISHGFGYETLYAHMQSIKVREGQKVKKGEIIGTIGNTGTSTGAHCHYEVHFNKKPVNPIHYCLDGLTPLEYQEMVEKAEIANQSFD
ncbi:MAG: M23 family metallopeptidase [Saprospiraceae bacterium]|uniref:M23 family metallopeptidase n=1 Tax=Candidatus Defluviibacterium haderslevense TaxID=2981993 RepID=A0A9D7SE97_9BACT|nr:M23 family metallopeptidase [Candidatus Defluviibacterium haderslevense]MBK7244862.1 M23 family metallopeptidase [Candidatus Defluviibacterium haderslevense]MBK9719569.1 M23 family metallopeptidase [Candidatus Defluviibacterium haderslevense]MBL0237961.1 M23 family metallopeptidase [Candidatus Defluviibacterium haderslevense]